MVRNTQPGLEKSDDARILLGLLKSVERDGSQSQRRLAAEFGIALGLVNAYLKRCTLKGLVKVKEAPARRYTYYLTPQGFAEKSRLTVEYLSFSFSFFRRARTDCTETLEFARQQRQWSRIVLAGVSDLAEIAAICALESGISIIGVVDAQTDKPRFIGIPVYASYEAIPESFDGVVVTDLHAAQDTFVAAASVLGQGRVTAPALLSITTNLNTAKAS